MCLMVILLGLILKKPFLSLSKLIGSAYEIGMQANTMQGLLKQFFSLNAKGNTVI